MIFRNLLTDPADIKEKVLSSIEKGESLLLTYFNQNCFNLYFKNSIYRNIIDKKFRIYPDGMGVYLFLKMSVNNRITRIDATSVNESILNWLVKRKVPVVIVGGDFNAEFEKKAIKSGINLAGYHNGFFDYSEFKEKALSISSCGNTFILGMGAPKQELFAAELQKTPGNKVIICSGNFLAFYFQYQKRAPVFFRKAGMEWLFRLLLEPRRLWKRYLLGIPEFFFRALKLKFFPKAAEKH
jgi:N-acetylglucosaminyldiphosphoundecaprenol N-acetyl-beta-D-mannosaminyltransferase